MSIKDAIKLLESSINEKVIKYSVLDNKSFLLLIETDMVHFKNNLFIVSEDGKIEVTIPELINGFEKLKFINL